MTSEAKENEQRLCGVMGVVFETELEEVQDADSPQTIAGWDSLSHLTFALALENAFGIRLTTAEIVEMKDVAAVKTVLRRHRIAI